MLAFPIIPVIFLCLQYETAPVDMGGQTNTLKCTTATNTHSDVNKLTCSLTGSHKLKKEVKTERERARWVESRRTSRVRKETMRKRRQKGGNEARVGVCERERHEEVEAGGGE